MDPRLRPAGMTTGKEYPLTLAVSPGHRSFAAPQDDLLGDSCPLPNSLQGQASTAGMTEGRSGMLE